MPIGFNKICYPALTGNNVLHPWGVKLNDVQCPYEIALFSLDEVRTQT